jgi:hypothetical protein
VILVADAHVHQTQLELVLASAGVAELEEVNKVILLLPCILLSLVHCTVALCSFALSVVSLLALLYLCSLFIRCYLSCCWRPVLSVPALGGFQEVTAGACESGVAGCRGAALCCFSRENARCCSVLF